MLGSLQDRFHASYPQRNAVDIHDLLAEFVGKVRKRSGKECFGTGLTHVCPDTYCRWRQDCYRFRLDGVPGTGAVAQMGSAPECRFDAPQSRG